MLAPPVLFVNRTLAAELGHTRGGGCRACSLHHSDQARPLEAWLNPDFTKLAAHDAILDDRERPHDEHELAA